MHLYIPRGERPDLPLTIETSSGTARLAVRIEFRMALPLADHPAPPLVTSSLAQIRGASSKYLPTS